VNSKKVLTLLILFILNSSKIVFSKNSPSFPFYSDIKKARKLHKRNPDKTPADIAKELNVGPQYLQIVEWMRDDLQNYYENFEEIFDRKLARIKEHSVQRNQDLNQWMTKIEKRLLEDVFNPKLQMEYTRIYELHKPQAFVGEYFTATDFKANFLAPHSKIRLSSLKSWEKERMDLPGKKFLYVDTWAVPFFNTGTQTKNQAKAGVKKALEVFKNLNLSSPLSFFEFTQLTALFARPEFDDLRRYKLLPFPTPEQYERFKKERSDAKIFGDLYPIEAAVFVNQALNLEQVSYPFGHKISLFGLISHTAENYADGRLFTGPADFLEHDYAHAFFNLTPSIPGNSSQWKFVHGLFFKKYQKEMDPKLKRMMLLIYYHFTHESGYRVLKPDNNGNINLRNFENEKLVIDELLHTRFHYDFILKGKTYNNDYAKYLDLAFDEVGGFFKKHFLRILIKERKKKSQCAIKLLSHFLKSGGSYV
jgi:hypothetical protein